VGATEGARPEASAAPPTVSVVLATLNERANLPELFERLLRQPLPPFEVIVVDDGSTDGTREYVTELAQRDPRFRTVFHDGKQTTVRAQGQGISVARGELLVIMDADLQHPPETLPSLVGALQGGAYLAVASRYAAGGSPGPRTFGRAAISRGAEWIARRLLPEARRVSDPVSGFFAFRREVYRPLDPEDRGYKLLLFLLVMNGGRPVREVGFRFAPRHEGSSKVTQSWAFVRVFLAELRLARAFRRKLLARPA
jgi:dolichol-phosphate mannosyltransferase